MIQGTTFQIDMRNGIILDSNEKRLAYRKAIIWEERVSDDCLPGGRDGLVDKLLDHLDPWSLAQLIPVRVKFCVSQRPHWFRTQKFKHRVTISTGHVSASKRCPKAVPWETMLVKDSVGQFLQAPDTGQGTCRVPANPWHWSGYLQSTCKPLTLVRIRNCLPIYIWCFTDYVKLCR